MNQNQNETGKKSGESLRSSAFRQFPTSARQGFTLTELLVVITIIAILAGLITGAAINALNTAKQATITLEIQQLNSAFEDFKNEYGAYPPNVLPSGSVALGMNNGEKTANAQILLRFMRKANARSSEFQINMASPPTRNTTLPSDNIFPIVNTGLSPAEAIVFWLQGFSQDVTRPLTGTDLEVTTIDDDGTDESDVITIDTRQPRYDFDRGRLRFSRDATSGDRRFLTVNRANGDEIYIQLYEYLAPGSQEPFVYFDTSRETPEQVVNNWTTTEFFYASPTSGGSIFPLKQMRANTPSTLPTNKLQYVEYVNPKKFQILHCGLDDAWGDFSLSGQLDVSAANGDFLPLLRFPTGPFIGDIADTVGNFMTGTLEAEQE